MTEKTDANTNDSLESLKQRAKGDSSSFLDSIFLSPKTMIIMALFFVVAMVIMGWFVFDYNASKYWIVNNAQIIATSKEEQAKLDTAKREIPGFVATKERLIAEAENAKKEAENAKKVADNAQEELSRFQKELKDVYREIDDQNATLSGLKEKIADAKTQKEEALRLADEAEQDIEKLRPLQQELNGAVQKKRDEVINLDGEYKAIKSQIDEHTKRLVTIKGVDNEFSQIQSQLSDVLTQLKTTNSSVQVNSDDLKRQIKSLLEENQRLSDEVTKLISRNDSFKKVADTIQTITGELQQSQTSLQKSDAGFSTLASQIDQVQKGIQKLGETINTSAESIEQLGAVSRSSRQTVMDSSAESADALIKLKADLASTQADLKRLSKLIIQIENAVPENLTPSGNN